MRYLVLLFCLSTSVFAQAVRVRGEWPKPDGLHTGWGTAWVTEQGCVSCWHVVDEAKVIYVEVQNSWIRCTIVKKDKDLDLVLLKPEFDLLTVKKEPSGCWAWISAESRPVKQISAKFKEQPQGSYLEIKDFNHGGSGSPVMQDGVLVAICKNMFALHDIVIADQAGYIPAAKVMEFLK